MLIQTIGLIVGVLVLSAGLYYLIKEKHEPEAKRIYTTISVIAAVCAALLLA